MAVKNYPANIMCNLKIAFHTLRFSFSTPSPKREIPEEDLSRRLIREELKRARDLDDNKSVSRQNFPRTVFGF